jgi:hypothetical protein
MENPLLYQPEEIPAGWRFQPVDEPGWYRSTVDRTVAWMVEHPSSQPRLMARRLYFTFQADTQALSDAEGFGTQPLVGPATRRWLDALANAWLWSVLALSFVGLLRVRRCRSAMPIWALVGLMLVPVLVGPALDRFHHPIVPLLVVLAAGALAGRDESDDIDLRVTVDVRTAPDDRRPVRLGRVALAPGRSTSGDGP